MHTTGRPDRLARFRMPECACVQNVMSAEVYRGRGFVVNDQCVIAYMSTLIPTAYPSGENR